MSSRKIRVLYLNIKGQTRLTLAKQLMIQDMIKFYRCDIIHLQEADIDENCFSACDLIRNDFFIIPNNSPSGYGTASLVRNEYAIENIRFDTHGRVIMFNIDNVTFGNIYLEAGTDSASRSAREKYLSEVIPNMLTNKCQTGFCGGDWNCIVEKKDATHYPESKISPNLTRLMNIFEWKDSYRCIFLNGNDFSHYYSSGSIDGATRVHSLRIL